MLSRRKALKVFAAGLFMAAPALLSYAQARLRRIGFLAPLARSTAANPDPFYDAFVQGMRELGYREGSTIVIDWRFAEGRFERLPSLAAELVRANPELIVTHSTPAIRALQRETSTIPIIFAVAIDPVGSGFAGSLARPGGNITGLSVIDVDPTPKRLELLKTLVPALSRVAVLVNPATSAHVRVVANARIAGEQAGIEVAAVEAGTAEAMGRAFEGLEAVIVADDALFRGERRRIAELALKARLPVIAPWREFAAVGGLASYGQDIADSFRRAALYADRVLKGAKPGELPIEQPTRIHLAINRKTAKALGLAIPSELLLRADEVID